MERPSYQVNELTKEALEKNFDSFKTTIANLRGVWDLTVERAVELLSNINSQNGHIYVAQLDSGEIIGTATLLVEQKLIRNGGKVGHVEDVATRKGYEGMGIGKALIAKLIVESETRFGCYKTILDCSNENVPFYVKTGFKLYENCMRRDA